MADQKKKVDFLWRPSLLWKISTLKEGEATEYWNSKRPMSIFLRSFISAPILPAKLWCYHFVTLSKWYLSIRKFTYRFLVWSVQTHELLMQPQEWGVMDLLTWEYLSDGQRYACARWFKSTAVKVLKVGRKTMKKYFLDQKSRFQKFFSKMIFLGDIAVFRKIGVIARKNGKDKNLVRKAFCSESI